MITKTTTILTEQEEVNQIRWTNQKSELTTTHKCDDEPDLKKQLRNACFTVNNYTEEEYQMFVKLGEDRTKCKYLIIAREQGELNGTPHLQGYIEFTRRISYMKFVTMTGRNFWARPRNGPQSAAIKYCKKQSSYQEWGDPRKQGKSNDLNVNVDISEMVQQYESGVKVPAMIKDGTINTTSKLLIADKMVSHLEDKRLFETNVMFLYGETGTGKTRSAIQYFAKKLEKDETDVSIFDDIYITSGSLKWFNGYDAHKYLIIDDFRQHHQQGNDILRMLDRYPYLLPTKGGFRQLLATDIIFTSCYDPINVFKNEKRDKENKELQQVMRRIKKTYLVEKDCKWTEKTKAMSSILKKLVDKRQ